jgi:hypothetical protein
VGDVEAQRQAGDSSDKPKRSRTYSISSDSGSGSGGGVVDPVVDTFIASSAI